MAKELFSMNDLYPFSSPVEDTTSQTLPSSDEAPMYNNNVVETGNGKKSLIDKKMIWGALLLIVGLLVALHFLGGE